MIQIISFILISLSSWSMDIGLEFSSKTIKQGSIAAALIKVDAASAHEIPLQKLKAKTFGDTVYIYEVGTPIRKEGRPYFEADAKVIFIKVPESNQLTSNEEGNTFKVFWNEVQVIPTEPDQTFLYGAFEAPGRFKAFRWMIGVLALLILVLAGTWGFRKYQVKVSNKKNLLEIKNKLLAANKYNDIVNVWMRRQIYLTTFPGIEEGFRNLEQELFKVQFKPHQSDSEKTDIEEAYRQFLISIKGVLDGI